MIDHEATDDDIVEAWQERAAIREFDGDARRGFAEQRAAAEIIRAIRPQEPPAWLVGIARGGQDQEKLFQH